MTTVSLAGGNAETNRTWLFFFLITLKPCSVSVPAKKKEQEKSVITTLSLAWGNKETNRTWLFFLFITLKPGSVSVPAKKGKVYDDDCLLLGVIKEQI